MDHAGPTERELLAGVVVGQGVDAGKEAAVLLDADVEIHDVLEAVIVVVVLAVLPVEIEVAGVVAGTDGVHPPDPGVLRTTTQSRLSGR
jgi:hypothetical protein